MASRAPSTARRPGHTWRLSRTPATRSSGCGSLTATRSDDEGNGPGVLDEYADQIMSTPYITPTKKLFPRLAVPGIYDVALGNATMHRIALMPAPDGGLFVAIERKGAYPFAHEVHFAYAQEKLNLSPYVGDACAIADFINDQLFPPGTVERQGCYHSQYA